MTTPPPEPKHILLRSEVPEKYKWDQFGNFPSHDAWREEFQKLDSVVEPILALKGTFREGPDKVVKVFELDDVLSLKLHLLDIHASLAHYQDLADAEATGMHSMLVAKQAELRAKTSWINPELLSLSTEQLNQYREYDGMKDWIRTFDLIVRYKPHTLTADEEAILSAMESSLAASQNSYQIFMGADLTFPVIEDDKGEKIQLTQGNYGRFLESQKLEVRRGAWNAMYDTVIKYKNTICSMLDGHIKAELLRFRTRKYESCIEHALFRNNIPVSVYTSLISAVHASLPSFHRYLSVRQRILKVPVLDMCDMYVPLIASIEVKVPYEQAVEWVLESIRPMGEEYYAVAKEGILGSGRWVDVMETKGKRTGACSIPNYGGKQYVLLNHNDTLNAAFTLAHELGHSMNHYYYCKEQPFRSIDSSVAVAEVASTFNEALLYRYLYDKAKKEGNKSMEIYLVNMRCDSFKSTIIRQTQFAEFELKLHEMAERGEPLTPDSISKLYKEINDFYYGDSTPKDSPTDPSASSAASTPSYPHVLHADSRIAFEFLRIPHFYFNFYVYQYATSMSVAEALFSHIMDGDNKEEALQKYFGLLKAGGCKDPLDILCEAGCDIRTPQPFIDALKTFDSLVNQLDALLADQK